MIKLIGDLLIDEYQLNEYTVRVTVKRETAEVMSIVLDHEFLGQPVSEVYYGTMAKELGLELIKAKLNRVFNTKSDVNLRRFSRRGVTVKTSEMNN